ncbi:hypothetical protein RSAG8_02344, partial [Rhizoctonia solani AG-8 WAC10335]
MAKKSRVQVRTGRLNDGRCKRVWLVTTVGYPARSAKASRLRLSRARPD